MTADHSSTRKRPLAPDLSQLDDRSVRAWTEAMAVDPLGGGLYEVDSQSGSRYVVDLVDGICSCPDSAIRSKRCKHTRRVAIEINRGEVPPPGKQRGDCTACSRETFLPEGGPALCRDCLYKAGDLVRDRETGDLLVVVDVPDERADEYVIEATGRTVADHDTNEGYPTDDPVVEVVYPADGETDADERRRYAFPHSRLEEFDRGDQQFVTDWSR